MPQMIWADGGILNDGGNFFAVHKIDIFNFHLPTTTVLFYPTQIPTPTIPEPGTLTILGLGLAGLGFARRRRMI